MDLIFFTFIGLILGAILPPLFFGRDWVSILVLNLCGFPFYVFPAFSLLGWMTWGDLPEDNQPADEEMLELFLACTVAYFALELLLFLLRWAVLLLIWITRLLLRCVRKHTNPPTPCDTP